MADIFWQESASKCACFYERRVCRVLSRRTVKSSSAASTPILFPSKVSVCFHALHAALEGLVDVLGIVFLFRTF